MADVAVEGASIGFVGAAIIQADKLSVVLRMSWTPLFRKLPDEMLECTCKRHGIAFATLRLV